MASHPDPTSTCTATPLVRTRGRRRTLEFAPGDIQSEMLLSDPDALVLDYTRAMMGFALFVPRPRHILMVGLGGGSLVKFCYRRFPGCRITVIELRADVIALREQFCVPQDDARLRIVHGDAAACLAPAGRRSGRPCADIAPADVILVDGFDRAGLPAALANAGFYRDCRALLHEGGVLVANVFTYDTRYHAVLAALDAVFGGRTCWLDKVAGNNRIVFAVRARDDAAPAARLQRRLARRRGLGLGWLNRLGIRLLLAWLTWRSVLSPPHSDGATRASR
ncbi:fused MFS/spermidine synthase [Massilia forsythiae]|uniref:Fused MFS/spermidine synthase n=1 Tax=Massilia forsythiae TaxID=2728020 RepID=A0A7Z2W193_9BURK|nr:fused MFS/spermidine synthase [Massilia forsythiae]QJE02925.1 fused MFS/spermidine synthase [Massilia forsythiae]